jgi:hypothetical protein
MMQSAVAQNEMAQKTRADAIMPPFKRDSGRAICVTLKRFAVIALLDAAFSEISAAAPPSVWIAQILRNMKCCYYQFYSGLFCAGTQDSQAKILAFASWQEQGEGEYTLFVSRSENLSVCVVAGLVPATHVYQHAMMEVLSISSAVRRTKFCTLASPKTSSVGHTKHRH